MSSQIKIPEGFKLSDNETLQNNNQSSSSQIKIPEGFKLSEERTAELPPLEDVIGDVTTKGSRLVTQHAIGALQRAAGPYDVAAIASRKMGQALGPHEFRKNILEDINYLAEQKMLGNFDENDEKRLQENIEMIKDPSKMDKYLNYELPHFDSGSLIEAGAKQFGVDLSPQDAAEFAARWTGLLKDPSKAVDLMKNGASLENIKNILKALVPTPSEALRGGGAAAGLAYATEAEFGPTGTMMALVLADLASQGPKAIFNFFKNPAGYYRNIKQAGKAGLARATATFATGERKALQEQIINEFREAGIQADLGTITGSNLVKQIQSTLDQSGLTGKALENFRNELTSNIVEQYSSLADGVGELIHDSAYSAGETLKNAVEEARDADLNEARTAYTNARQMRGETQIYPGTIARKAVELEESLTPGSVKSPAQQQALDIIRKIRSDVITPTGEITSTSINELINNKIALSDIIDYEVQGGTKQLLKGLVRSIDEAIEEYGQTDPEFLRQWKNANKLFSQHAKTYRSRAISNLLRNQDPAQALNQMKTVHGINKIKEALKPLPNGKEIFNNLARYKLEEMIGKNMVDSTSQQLKLGTFSKLLEKGKNREVMRALIGDQALSRLQKLQKVSGRLADTAQKFFNNSKTAVRASDIAFAGKILNDLKSVLSGNPWPIVKSGGFLLAGREVAKLMADPEFLKMVEDSILQSQKASGPQLTKIALRLANKAKEILEPSRAAVQETD